MSKKRSGSRMGMTIIVVIVVLICILICYKTTGLSETLLRKQNELAEVNASILKAREDTVRIENEIKYRETDDYIEDKARENLGLRYPDEIIIVPSEGSTE